MVVNLSNFIIICLFLKLDTTNLEEIQDSHEVNIYEHPFHKQVVDTSIFFPSDVHTGLHDFVETWMSEYFERVSSCFQSNVKIFLEGLVK